MASMMRHAPMAAVVLAVVAPTAGGGAAPAPAPPAAPKGILLEDLTWIEARDRLKPDTIVVVPLGAESKEHGPHLRLRNDWTMAEYLKRRVLEQAAVVVAPTINYSYYPAFVEYPGSTSLRLETARDLVVDICRSLARHGPRRFYVLNTGVSTRKPLEAAAAILAGDRILLRFTDIVAAGEPAASRVMQEKAGTHADEIETSMMLYIDPSSVDMSKATRDFPEGAGPLTPEKGKPGAYSPSGVFGDATLATRDKGKAVVEATVEAILRDLDDLRRATPP
jgi:creatinine amidohydrolase